MDIGSTWKELAAQQLVRYEALFKLLDDIQGLDDIPMMSGLVAKQWKYFASVCSWRLVVFHERVFHVIDGFRGEAKITEERDLSAWDAHHRSLQRPCAIRSPDPLNGPRPPVHLAGERIADVRVFPFTRAERWIALLSVATRNEPFSELDTKFIRIFGSHFADRISDILLRRQATDALIEKASRDALTGLYNRGTIVEMLQECLADSNRTGQPLSTYP